jgi:cation diffusion facilitator family transporter
VADDFSSSARPPTDPERYRAAQRSTWVSVAVNILLTLTQVGVGLLAHAQSLVADGIHSASDLLADFFVLYANRRGSHPADPEHPYGHGRFETAASLVLGALLAGTGLVLLVSAGARLQNVEHLPEVQPLALWVAFGTLAAKEGLFRYMLAVAERLRSPLLVANAWHARSDAASSLVVAAGIGGSLMGYRFLDLVAATVVGFLILRMGWKFGYEALRELIDTGLEEETVDAIRNTLLNTPGVIDLHELRTRRMAHQALVDAHIRVDPRISVSEGHASPKMRVIKY